ncbi:MAG TPA: DUF692 domain-containing protein [Usitatibacter sp.]|nr:DUF692 domain-containing protein [Usitatibacter sp.]
MFGIGLRAPHYAEILRTRPRVEFLEVHSENFFAQGGPATRWLERFRAEYPLSFHGVGLSLGSADALDERHLARLHEQVRRFEPRLVSEHLSWSAFGGRHANDLLPLPFTREAVALASARISQVQDRLRRRILVENVSAYVSLAGAEVPEWAFVAEVVRASGCGLLLDVNNVRVNAVNQGFDALDYLDALDPACVGEIHVAGHERAGALLVDTHAGPVAPEVWDLYEAALRRFGAAPTLVEWDANIPPLELLLGEAERARAIAQGVREACAA